MLYLLSYCLGPSLFPLAFSSELHCGPTADARLRTPVAPVAAAVALKLTPEHPEAISSNLNTGQLRLVRSIRLARALRSMRVMRLFRGLACSSAL